MSLLGLKLYISNLSTQTTDAQLEEHFKGLGEIVWCQVVKDRHSGDSKGYGFVTFKRDEDGETALQELNGSVLDGRKIEIEKSKQGQALVDSAGESKQVGDDEIRLFVGGLPDGCGEADLMELFAESEPVEAFVCRQKNPPCGFVTIKRSEKNLEAAEKHDGIYFKDSKWRLAVKAAKPPQRGDDRGGRGGRGRGEARLFIGGLPEGVTEADLLAKFKACDPIDAFVPPRQTALPFYGFVTVRDEGDNIREAFAMDQTPFEEGAEHRLSVAYSKPRPSERDRYGGGRGRSRSRDRYDDRYGGRRGRSRSRSPYGRRRGGRSRSRSRSYDRRRRSPSYDRHRGRSRSRSYGRDRY